MRQIQHPGPPFPERVTAVPGAPVPLRFSLEAGLSVDVAIARGFAAAGCLGGYVVLRGGRCEPFRFVMPAASPDDAHAAWYSDTFAPEGSVRIERAGAIVGERDGRFFIHCHGLWETPEGRRMGHMLAPDTVVTEPVEAVGIGFRDATFMAAPDPETHFTLFGPVSRVQGGEEPVGPRVLLARVRPNEDIGTAIESLCGRWGIARANVHGIGSLNGVRFADGRRVEAHATEVLIHEGRTGPDGVMRIDVVDMDGHIHSGPIVEGDNPVCVTFELLIEEIPGP
ncbi:PCC domain-containing protein [Microvirga pudoricolor]|uniref:PCC domain-containing protein n=1 Tax=Microvirga pudoricolor TaxID=2778729 RepID=UPI00195105CB|nr:DUF296 domain-containing protein [Microvirga pudoricolor]MBM6593493.1 DUF296 domain-containing protein [Microvirga pudoricolor]